MPRIEIDPEPKSVVIEPPPLQFYGLWATVPEHGLAIDRTDRGAAGKTAEAPTILWACKGIIGGRDSWRRGIRKNRYNLPNQV